MKACAPLLSLHHHNTYHHSSFAAVQAARSHGGRRSTLMRGVVSGVTGRTLTVHQTRENSDAGSGRKQTVTNSVCNNSSFHYNRSPQEIVCPGGGLRGAISHCAVDWYSTQQKVGVLTTPSRGLQFHLGPTLTALTLITPSRKL